MDEKSCDVHTLSRLVSRLNDILNNSKKDNFLSLLYQTGYLTIKRARKIEGSYLFTPGCPNAEVERGLNNILLPLYLGSEAGSFKGVRIRALLEDGKTDEVLTEIKTIYDEHVFDKESAWHTSFPAVMKTTGVDIIGEESTDKGRIDAVITCPEEFKLDKSAHEALSRIKEKKTMRNISPRVRRYILSA